MGLMSLLLGLGEFALGIYFDFLGGLGNGLCDESNELTKAENTVSTTSKTHPSPSSVWPNASNPKQACS